MAFCNHIRPLKPPKPKPKPVFVKASPPSIYRLFEKKYKCEIRAGDIRDVEDVRTNGVLRTGDKAIDAAADSSYQPLGMTVFEMTKRFDEGIRFHIVDREQYKQIFEDIIEHTDNWRHLLQTGYNVGTAPAEDLIRFEVFAAAIYDYAKYKYVERNPKDIEKGSLADFLYSGSTMQSAYTGRGAISAPMVRDPAFAVKEMSYTPQIDIFKEVLVRQYVNQAPRRD